MPENYDHYISKNIKAFYKRRLAAPIIYLIILAWHFFSLSAVFSPDILPDDTSLETAFRGGKQYISTTLSDLKFTGYTQSIFGHTNGYYYYTMRDEECIIVLLSPNTSEEGLPSIEEVTIKGKISKGNENFDTLLSNLSTDLNWTENGIRNKVSSYYISEPGFNHVGNWILFAAIFITGIYALLCIVLSVIYMFFPVLSPACQDLALFGNPKKMLEQAEEELATLPQLATEDMFITEHFFIETSVYGNAIVPIDEIIWIYKYSTLHKFFWYHFSISYTLHISANKHLYIQCPKNHLPLSLWKTNFTNPFFIICRYDSRHAYLHDVLIDSIATAPPRTTSIRWNLDFNRAISSLFLRSVSLHSKSTLSLPISATCTLNTCAIWNTSSFPASLTSNTFANKISFM